MQAIIIFAAIFGVFAYCTWFGLFIQLGYDDVMNISLAWLPPLHKLVLALLNPLTTLYRPTGSLVYRTLFTLFSLNPFPFRVVFYALLLINLLLVFKLASRLSRSSEIGAVSALIYSIHGRLSAIYLNNGTLYDVLCATLTFTTLLFYIKMREKGAFLSFRAGCVFVVLFILALNAKEMAAAIPVILFFYELLFHPPKIRAFIPLVIVLTISLAAAHAKMGEGSVMHDTAPYQMTISANQFFTHWGHLMAELIYSGKESLATATVVWIWAALIAIAAILRKRYIWLFLAFALLAPLPVIFIPYRGFFVMYLPWAGWAMFIASVLVTASKFDVVKLMLFALVAVAVIWIPAQDAKSIKARTDPDEGQAVISRMTDDILDLDEPLPAGARVLFLRDRFPKDAWGTVMICRLLYRDRDLWADRPTMMDHPPDLSSYDRVFDYVRGRLVVVSRKAGPHPRRVLNYPE